MACRPTRWPKRDAYPVSVFRWNAHWLRSLLRNTQRKKFKPHTWSRAWGNRSWENGIRISTTQPNESTDVATSHTGSQDRSRSEEHTSELQSQSNLVCRLLLEKKKNKHRERVDDSSNQRQKSSCTKHTAL